MRKTRIAMVLAGVLSVGATIGATGLSGVASATAPVSVSADSASGNVQVGSQSAPDGTTTSENTGSEALSGDPRAANDVQIGSQVATVGGGSDVAESANTESVTGADPSGAAPETVGGNA